MNRQVTFKGEAWESYLYWHTADNRNLKRIHQLLKDIDRNEHEGMGKPEQLKYNLQGWWSRRIDEQHRLVYRVDEHEIQILSCRFHYEK